jgi:hypothetical protein
VLFDIHACFVINDIDPVDGCLFVHICLSNFSAIRRQSTLPVTVLQINPILSTYDF